MKKKTIRLWNTQTKHSSTFRFEYSKYFINNEVTNDEEKTHSEQWQNLSLNHVKILIRKWLETAWFNVVTFVRMQMLNYIKTVAKIE